MGKKALATVLTACLLITPVRVYASSTAVDLYKMYGKEYVIEYPEGVLKTLKNYSNAERYIYQYQYITSSTYDKQQVLDNIKELKASRKSLRNRLLNAFNLELSEIYALEDELRDIEKKLEELKSSLKSVDIDTDIPSGEDLPTSSDYRVALETKSIIDRRADLGDIKNLPYPVSSACMVKDSDDTSLTLLTIDGALVTPIWAGRVVKVEDDYVIVYHYNNIYTRYSGLSYISVKEGNELGTRDTLGKASRLLKLELRIDKDLVDISKLFTSE